MSVIGMKVKTPSVIRERREGCERSKAVSSSKHTAEHLRKAGREKNVSVMTKAVSSKDDTANIRERREGR